MQEQDGATGADAHMGMLVSEALVQNVHVVFRRRKVSENHSDQARLVKGNWKLRCYHETLSVVQ